MSRRRDALHEAAHAVAAVELGEADTIVEVVVGERKAGTAGYVRFARDPGAHTPAEIVTSLLGPLLDADFEGIDWPPAWEEAQVDELEQLGKRLQACGITEPAHYYRLAKIALQLADDRAFRGKVYRLADALEKHERLSGAEIAVVLAGGKIKRSEERRSADLENNRRRLALEEAAL